MEVKPTLNFIRAAKPLEKKYRSFKQDYKDFIDELKKNPELGTDLGGGIRKVRMAITSKGKGKSGGARIITFNTIQKNGILYLISVYDKSEYETVKLEVVKKIVKEEEGLL